MAIRNPVSSAWTGSGAAVAFLVAVAILVLLTMQLPEGTGRAPAGRAAPERGAAAAIDR
jgi:hypothetical protein